MDIIEAVRSGLKELILPELENIKHDSREIKTKLDMTNKRLDDVNIHLADQSRRIDETNKRIDSVRDYLLARIDETNNKIDEVNERLSGKIDETNDRLNRLYEVIVRRDEHDKLEFRIIKIEEELNVIKEKIAA